ncbi:MAG: hypothetical protein GY751_21425 [Bacteroidetes bacterium]|nr:hypothetical protein [Bacteroidota bacterium]
MLCFKISLNIFILYIAVTILPFFTTASAQDILNKIPVGNAAKIVNFVEGRDLNSRRKLSINDPVYMYEKISAKLNSHGEIKLNDNTKIIVGPGAEISLDDFVVANNEIVSGTVSVLKGAFRFISGNAPKGTFSVKTPLSTIGIRGTQFDVYVAGGGKTDVIIYSGSVQVCNLQNSCRILQEACDIVRVPSRGNIHYKKFLRSDNKAKENKDYNLVNNQQRFDSEWRAPVKTCEARSEKLKAKKKKKRKKKNGRRAQIDPNPIEYHSDVTDEEKTAIADDPGRFVNQWLGQVSGIVPNPLGTATQVLRNSGVSASTVSNSFDLSPDPIGVESPMTGDIRGKYSYTSWGRWDGDWDVSDPAGNITNGHWVLGKPTILTDVVRNIGKATYRGGLHGDYIDSNGAVSQDVISGDTTVTANFSTLKVDVDLSLKKNGVAWTNLNFSNVTIDTPTAPGSSDKALVFSSSVNTKSQQSTMIGIFNGPKAEEVGGDFSLSRTLSPGVTDGAAGIFYGKR